MILHHIAKALQEETIDQIRHHTYQDPQHTEILGHNNAPGEFIFAASFQVMYFDDRGGHTLTVTISESNDRR